MLYELCLKVDIYYNFTLYFKTPFQNGIIF